MLDNQQEYIDKIFRSLDDMEKLFNQEADLQTDVATFMKSVFLKIKRLCIQTNDQSYLYDLYKIAVIFLPRTFEAYCDFPVDVRNLRIVKDNETSRTILIKDLTLIKNQVLTIENEIYSSLDTKVRVNSSILKEQFDNQMSLATDTELNTAFENQFNIQAYMESEAFQKQILYKPVTTNEVQLEQEKEKTLEKAKKKAFRHEQWMNRLAVFQRKAKRLFKWTCILGIFYSIGFGIHYLVFDTKSSNNLQWSSAQEFANIEHMLRTTPVNDTQLKEYIANSDKIIIDGNNWKAHHLELKTEGAMIQAKISGLDNDDCKTFIDSQYPLFADATLKINNIDLPQNDMQYSNLYDDKAQHPDYKLCYLNKDNIINLNFDSARIYNQHQTLIHGPVDAINSKTASLKQLQGQLDNEVNLYRRQTEISQRKDIESGFVGNQINDLLKVLPH